MPQNHKAGRGHTVNSHFGKKLLYAGGQFGLALSGYGIVKLFTFFFVARGVSGVRLFPDYIYRNDLFGYFTAAGLIIALSRIVDTFSGIFSGWLSDRALLRRGRRTSMMRGISIPIALFSVLVFFPPAANNALLNTVVICLFSVAFFLSYSLYAIPYYALIAELGVNARDRLQLSTLMAVATALASLAGNRILALMESVSEMTGLGPLPSFRLIVILYAAVSVVFLLLPAFLLTDVVPPDATRVRDSLPASFKAVLSDRLYRPYLIADVAWRVASTVTITGFLYFVTVLLGLPAARADYFLLMIFVVNLALYLPIYRAAAKFGKKRLLTFAFAVLALDLALLVPAGNYPFSAEAQGWILSLLFGFSLAVFAVIPNALIGDISVACERKTGQLRAGMYFGVQSFLSRFAQMVVILLFPFFVSLSSTLPTADPSAAPVMTVPGLIPSALGLRIALALATVSAIVGLLAITAYREKEAGVLFD